MTIPSIAPVARRVWSESSTWLATPYFTIVKLSETGVER
jgi:hypothetical protein